MTTRQRLVSAIVAFWLALAATPAAAQQSSNDRATALLGIGRVKRQAGDFASARKYFEDVRKIRPLSNSELVEYFWIVAGRDAKASIDAGRQVLANAPGSTDVRERVIADAISLGDEALVIALAEAGQRQEPSSSRWPRRAAESYVRQGKTDQAAIAFGAAVAAGSASEADRIGMALALEGSRQYAAARSAWLQVSVETRTSRDDYGRSWLRAVANAGDVSESSKELEAWLGTHRTDDEVRELLVGAWVRASQPGKAAQALADVPNGPTKLKWLRRRASLAREAGLNDLAISTQEAIVAATKSAADRRTLAAWSADARDYDRAAAALKPLLAANGCDIPTLQIADRIPGSAGTALLVSALTTHNCGNVVWIDRGIERTVAESKFQDALRLAHRLPPAAAARPDSLRLTGQLQLWTGDVRSAIATLERAKSAMPADLSVHEALVDAYRANHDAAAAWLAAAPLVSDGNASPARIQTAAEVAFEAGRPMDAARLLDRLPAGSQKDKEVVALRDRIGITTRATSVRALVAAGKYREALDLLGPREKWETVGSDAGQLAAKCWYALAADAFSRGDTESALSGAETTIELDPELTEAWFLFIDAAEKSSRPKLDAAIQKLEPMAAAQPKLLVSLAERLSSVVRSADDPLVPKLLSWLESAEADSELTPGTRAMARAHIYSAIEDWPHALKAVNQGLEQDPENARALKLRADVLSWSGRHAEAVAAYASYLERSPADRDARRQQARIAGWSGSFRTATAFYSKLRIDFADDKVIQAEAAAKIAYFGGRWTDAVEAYKRLVALEPSNSEARFELAESQRAAHRTSDARQTLNRLAADSQHRLATAALQRDAFISAPSVTGGTDYVSSVGYAGRRLLDLQRASAGLTFGSSATAFRVSARTGGLRVTSGDAEQQSGFAGLEVEAKTGTLSFDGRTEVSRLSATQTEFLASVGWTPGDRWTLGGGVQRMALRENMTTVDQNLSGTGPFVRVQFDSPLAFVEIWSGWQELSDSNTRQQTTVVVSRALSEQRKGLRMVMWAERLSFGYQTADYYSPSGQNRIDAGLQYEHVLFKPRFRSDRRKTITTGYMIGTDNDGVLYQHPLIALDVEFANGLVLYGRAELIRSSVYRDNRFSVNLRLQDAFRQSKK